MANTDWENFGDVNYLSYGGLLIRQDPDYMDRTYNVVQVSTHDASSDIPEGYAWALYYSVDLDDNWYDWDSVASAAGQGLAQPDKNLVQMLVNYYGPHEFSPSGFGKDGASCVAIPYLSNCLTELGAGDFARC